MPPKDPELIALRKELEDLIAKCQVIRHLFHCIYYFIVSFNCIVVFIFMF